MGQMTVFSGSAGGAGVAMSGNRSWRRAFSVGACVSQVAHRRFHSTALIYTWRRKMCVPVIEPGFAQALVIDGNRAEPSIELLAIIVELASGKRVSIFGSAPPALATAALKALR